MDVSANYSNYFNSVHWYLHHYLNKFVFMHSFYYVYMYNFRVIWIQTEHKTEAAGVCCFSLSVWRSLVLWVVLGQNNLNQIFCHLVKNLARLPLIRLYLHTRSDISFSNSLLTWLLCIYCIKIACCYSYWLFILQISHNNPDLYHQTKAVHCLCQIKGFKVEKD